MPEYLLIDSWPLLVKGRPLKHYILVTSRLPFSGTKKNFQDTGEAPGKGNRETEVFEMGICLHIWELPSGTAGSLRDKGKQSRHHQHLL